MMMINFSYTPFETINWGAASNSNCLTGATDLTIKEHNTRRALTLLHNAVINCIATKSGIYWLFTKGVYISIFNYRCQLFELQRHRQFIAWKRQRCECLQMSELAICPDNPRRRRPLKFCMRGRVREMVIYFKFHENRSRGLRAVEGRKSPSPIDFTHGLYVGA